MQDSYNVIVFQVAELEPGDEGKSLWNTGASSSSCETGTALSRGDTGSTNPFTPCFPTGASAFPQTFPLFQWTRLEKSFQILTEQGWELCWDEGKLGAEMRNMKDTAEGWARSPRGAAIQAHIPGKAPLVPAGDRHRVRESCES